MPKTDEEREIAEEESKIYLSGNLKFMKDDPGRQAIGSFNPLTGDDWTEMAYVGNTQELCQYICNGNLKLVQKWCEDHPESIDRRDHTGRTPLHLAAQSSTHEVLKCLVDYGARIVARLVDGFTALHLASARGEVNMVATLLEKSEENESAENEKEEQRLAAKRAKVPTYSDSLEHESDGSQDDGTDTEMDDAEDSDEDTTMTEGSFVKIDDRKIEEDALDGEDSDPDVYDVNVLAWDSPVSPLHLAILGGHTRTVELLVGKFGADVLLPVKILNSYSRKPEQAIMTLVLAAQLSGNTAVQAVEQLLSLGASSAQADMNQITALHYIAARKRIDLLKVCFDNDGAAAKSVLDHLTMDQTYWNPETHNPLITAIRRSDSNVAGTLLNFGAKPTIEMSDFAHVYTHDRQERHPWWRSENEDISKVWKETVIQPVTMAIEKDMPDLALQLLQAGADANTLDVEAHKTLFRYAEGQTFTVSGDTLLDATVTKLANIESAINPRRRLAKPITLNSDENYIEGTAPDSYERWYLSKSIETAKTVVKQWHDERERVLAEDKDQPGKQQKLEALRSLQDSFKEVRDRLLDKGAKTLKQLHPELFKRKREGSSIEESDQASEDGRKGEPTFEPKVSFKLSGSDKTDDGYLQLFEAAWKGEIYRVKELTLANWGPERDHTPLLITTQDTKGFTPFVIAIYRRELKLGKVILDIADAQYKVPDEKPSRRRYTILENDSDYSCADDGDDLGLTSEIVDETFTYDDISSLRQSLGSQVSGKAGIPYDDICQANHQ